MKEHAKYKRVGLLGGRFYDATSGEPKEIFPWKRLAERKAAEEERKRTFPGCNSKWESGVGATVWCTVKSGGVTREWVGVPRLYRDPSSTSDRKRCVCVPLERASADGLEEYPGCDVASDKCAVESAKTA